MFTFLLADSEIRGLRHLQGTDQWVIEFSAARVLQGEAQRSSGPHHPTEGYLKPLMLRLEGVQWLPAEHTHRITHECYGAVAEGRLLLDQQAQPHIALPLQYTGPVSLSLTMRARDSWQCHASQIQIDVGPEARFIESMAC